MAKIETIIDTALRTAGVPIAHIYSTSADPADRTGWHIVFDPAATPAQRTQGQTIVNTVAIDAAAQAAQDDKEAQAQIDTLNILLKAIVLALIDQLNVIRAALPTPKPDITPAQAITAIRAKAGTL